VDEFWDTLFQHMLAVAFENVMRMEEKVSEYDSPEALCLLVEAADNYQFLRQAYHDKCAGDIHVEFKPY